MIWFPAQKEIRLWDSQTRWSCLCTFPCAYVSSVRLYQIHAATAVSRWARMLSSTSQTEARWPWRSCGEYEIGIWTFVLYGCRSTGLMCDYCLLLTTNEMVLSLVNLPSVIVNITNSEYPREYDRYSHAKNSRHIIVTIQQQGRKIYVRSSVYHSVGVSLQQGSFHRSIPFSSACVYL